MLKTFRKVVLTLRPKRLNFLGGSFLEDKILVRAPEACRMESFEKMQLAQAQGSRVDFGHPDLNPSGGFKTAVQFGRPGQIVTAQG